MQLIDNQVDARSGTVRVRAVFDNADGSLMPGQFARLRMGQPKTEPRVADQRARGRHRPEQEIRDGRRQGQTRRNIAKLRSASSIEGLRVVTGGLHAGERIVVKGLQRVRPGALVAPEVVAMGFASIREPRWRNARQPDPGALASTGQISRTTKLDQCGRSRRAAPGHALRSLTSARQCHELSKFLSIGRSSRACCRP